MAAFSESANNHVCIVGGGPAGVVLSLILARCGIPVSLLEGQADFDREFRGDTLHASSLEILEELGVAEAILAISNARLERLQFRLADRTMTIAEFAGLDTPYPYVALIPQERFLGFLVQEAEQTGSFRIRFNATVTDLIEENGRVNGVRYVHEGEQRDMRAALVVGADGRGSTVRQKSGLTLSRRAPPMDVLWFKVPRDPAFRGSAAELRFGSGTMLVIIDRGDYWQMGYVMLKGSYRELRQAGMPAFRGKLIGMAPELRAALETMQEWSQCAILSVVTGRVERWYRPGLLLIGDAAHVMSPVGGVGINYAIQDAVAAANRLAGPLREGAVRNRDLAQVQADREKAVRFIQRIQSLIQRRIIAAALKSDAPFQPPLPLRIATRFAFVRRRIARTIAYGLRHETIKVLPSR